MPGIYDITDKTYIRPADRIEELVGSNDQLFGKFAGNYSGSIWYVNHNLRSTNLLIGIWKDDISNPASYWQIDQVDYENLEIYWTTPCSGRVVLYSVRDFAGVAIVWEQTTASNIWTITHNFGTTDVIYTCWEGSNIISPVSAQSLDSNTVELTFSWPVSGTCVMLLADPESNPSVHVDWNNIYNLPVTGFPPAAHTHNASDINGIGNTNTLGGRPAEDYLTKDTLGVTVAPLATESPTDSTKRIPVQYMPSAIPFWVSDSDGKIKITEFQVDSASPQPLYLTKYPAQQKAVLHIKPVLRKLQLMGNVNANPAVSNNAVEVSSDFLIRLVAGTGLSVRAEDQHTLKIGMQQGVAKMFQRPVLSNGAIWDITDSIFDTQGSYAITAFESVVPSGTNSGSSEHIGLTPAITDIDTVFETSGDDMLEMSGREVSDKILLVDDHFVWTDDIVKASDSTPIQPPDGVDNVWFDSTLNAYIFRNSDTWGYFFRKFDPADNTISFLYSCNAASMPDHIMIAGGIIYCIREVTGGSFELLQASPYTMPSLTWTLVAAFGTEAIPVVSGEGRLRFRINGDYLVILNTTLNTLAVYSISMAAKLHEKVLTWVAKDFDLWGDMYCSISTFGEDKLYVSDRPIYDYAYTWRKSIDNGMGECTSFSIRSDGLGACGITMDEYIRKSTVSYMGTIQLYRYGEETLWIRSPYCWNVSTFWNAVLTMSWEDYDISAYSDVRIGFFPSDSATMPDVLYRWNGTAFVNPFPPDQLPIMGQDISVVNTIQLNGGDKFSYALYIKKSDTQATQMGHIRHNFLITYQNAGVMYPVPVGGPSNPDHLLITCSVGAVRVTNNLGRQLDGFRLVVTPAM